MTIKELCYALQKISETEGDLSIAIEDINTVLVRDILVDHYIDDNGDAHRVVMLCS